MVPLLYDALVRHQLMLDRLIKTEASKFSDTLFAFRADLREIMAEVPFEGLSALTKKKFLDLLRRVREAQRKHFSAYTQAMLRELESYAETDTAVQGDLIKATQEEDNDRSTLLALLFTKAGRSRLWATIRNADVQAVGYSPEIFATRFASTSLNEIEAILRRGYASKLPLSETMASIVGTRKANYRDGAFIKLDRYARGMTATLYQHVTGQVAQAVGQIYFEKYTWVSVLDSKTSPVCTARDGRTYEYGRGPLPPAHPNCRSHVAPFMEDMPTETYGQWLLRQPREVRKEVNDRPLTLAEFLAKVPLMLAS